MTEYLIAFHDEWVRRFRVPMQPPETSQRSRRALLPRDTRGA
jgi:hypothetical protein